MEQKKIHYAYDETGELVDITSVYKGDGHTYYCFFCKQELIPKQGKIRDWHFAHKSNSLQPCSYDHYLHSLAINKIHRWYQNSQDVFVRLRNTHTCEISNCRWKTDACSKPGLTEAINLKSYYGFAEVEKEFETKSGKFRADIMLSSTRHPNDPIFLEIYVTHACTPEKIASGLRIIEIKISSEEDLEHLISGNVLQESVNFLGDEDCFDSNRNRVKFYGFRPADMFVADMKQPLQKFILYPSHKMFLANVTCKNHEIRKGIFEVTSLDKHYLCQSSFFDSCLAKVFQMGLVDKSCDLCKYMYLDSRMAYVEVCELSEKIGTKRFCQDNDAGKCKYFSVNEQLLKEGLETFDKYTEKCRFETWCKDV